MEEERTRDDSSVPEMLEIKVPSATKDGEIIRFEIKTVTTLTDFPSCEMSTTRTFEDVEWLHNCLSVREDPGGSIVPPMPNRPASTAAEAEALMKQEFGGEMRNMLADQIPKYCRSVEMFLCLLAKHARYRRSEPLKQFLVSEPLPPRVLAKLSMFKRATNVVKDKGLQSKKDPDEFFHGQRGFVHESHQCMKDVNVVFHQQLVAQRQFAMSLGAFASNITKAGSSACSSIESHTKLMTRFGQVMDQCQQSENTLATSSENSFAFTFCVFEKYLESSKDMLNRRLRLLTESEAAAAAAVKAKASNKAKADAAREDAVQKFEEISRLGRTELSLFHQLRVHSLQTALVTYCQNQISTGRDTYAMLARSLSELRQIDDE
ncbi:sorting nexin-6-like [Sycon ciliatum]|uniref:sorting nexin-6-like n=1 Tax=Sycon ciliatum TaxID=27933 RepID=UPI0031F6F698